MEILEPVNRGTTPFNLNGGLEPEFEYIVLGNVGNASGMVIPLKQGGMSSEAELLGGTPEPIAMGAENEIAFLNPIGSQSNSNGSNIGSNPSDPIAIEIAESESSNTDLLTGTSEGDPVDSMNDGLLTDEGTSDGPDELTGEKSIDNEDSSVKPDNIILAESDPSVKPDNIILAESDPSDAMLPTDEGTSSNKLPPTDDSAAIDDPSLLPLEPPGGFETPLPHINELPPTDDPIAIDAPPFLELQPPGLEPPLPQIEDTKLPVEPTLPEDPVLIVTPLSPSNDQVWSQDTPSIEGVPKLFDHFGRVLATGDFNGDGYMDLAIGAPNDSLETENSSNMVRHSGAVTMLYGSANGLSSANSQMLSQNNAAESSDRFGTSLAAGDFNGDGYTDLAVGIPEKDIAPSDSASDAIVNAGAVQIFFGSANGLDPGKNSQTLHQNSFKMEGDGSESHDRFGASLAAGDFNGDGIDDLAIGVPGEDIGAIADAGAVNLVFGGAKELYSLNSRFWHQNSPGVEDEAEAGDRFGTSLTANDFNGDGIDDLAIGVPYEDIENITDAGAANIIYGSSNPSIAENGQIWHQNSAGILDSAEAHDRLGTSLTSGDYNGDGFADLAVGVSFESIGSIKEAGAVNVLYGSEKHLSSTGNQFWHQNSAGIQGVAQTYDYFGYSLTSADFDNDGYDDLAAGVLFERVGDLNGAGSVNILRGSSDRITNKNDRLISQNTLNLSEEVAESFDGFGYSVAGGDFNNDGYADLAVGVPYEDLELSSGSSVHHAGAVNVLYDA